MHMLYFSCNSILTQFICRALGAISKTDIWRVCW